MACNQKAKNERTGKSRRLLWAIIAAVAVAALVAAALTGLRTRETDIQTPYCTLQYPQKWADRVQIRTVEEPEYCVSYSAVLSGREEIPLFDIVFAEEASNSAGYIQTETGELISVNVTVHSQEAETNRTEEEWTVIREMTDDLNYILERIPFWMDQEETAPAEAPAAQADPARDVVFETPYAQLVYPGKWADRVEVSDSQEGDYTVRYSAVLENAASQPLFDIVFSDSGELGVLSVDGNLIGVSLVMHPVIPDSSWETAQIETLESMQEDVNYIISHLELQEAPAADLPEETAEAPEETRPAAAESGDLLIDTPYGPLVYPGKWRSMVMAEVLGTDLCIVTFQGTVGSHESVHLFSVCLGDTADNAIGTALDKDGKEIAVSIIPSEFVPGDDWSGEDSALLYEMMEDVNYLLSNLLVE